MLIIFAIFLSYISYNYGQRLIVKRARRKRKKIKIALHYFGLYPLLLLTITSILFFALNALIELPDLHSYIAFVVVMFGAYSYLKLTIQPSLNAQEVCENIITVLLKISALLSVVITIAILLSLFLEAYKFFEIVPIYKFLFGTKWSPQATITTQGAVNTSAFGFIPVFTGSLLITIIALLFAIPLGVFTAVCIAEYIPYKLRNILKSVFEILAAIPTVVYGYIAIVFVSPLITNIGKYYNFEIPTENALSAGVVIGIMITPYIISLTDDALIAVPLRIREGALAMGSTKSEMIYKVVLPYIYPSILSSILLAFARAIGETMIVTMAAGLTAHLTFNPIQPVTTVTAQIVHLLVGDQTFDSPKTLSAYALGLCLFIITLLINMLARYIINRHNKRYAL